MKSIFANKNKVPSSEELATGLGMSVEFWKQIAAYATTALPAASAKWHFSGEKYGWSFRISDRKRVIVYLLPRDGFFRAAFVFGNKATEAVLASGVLRQIKDELIAAKPYAEGRGIRIAVSDQAVTNDIFRLIDIKIGN